MFTMHHVIWQLIEVYLFSFRFKDNFLRVIIYYEDLNYEVIKEDPLYDVSIFDKEQ